MDRGSRGHCRVDFCGAVGVGLVSDFLDPFNFCEMKKAILKPISAAPTASFKRTGINSGKMIFNPNESTMCLVYIDIDGFWKMEAESFGTGLIESGHMKMICNKLDEINQGFEEELKSYFDSLPKEIDQTPHHDDTPF